MRSISLFDIKMDVADRASALDEIIRRLRAAEKTFIVTPNVDHVLRYRSDAKFREVYAKASLVFADGWPVVWASRFLRKPLPERVAGSDLMPKLCEAVQGKYSVFFLGGSKLTPEKLIQKFKNEYPGLKVAGAYSPGPQELKDPENVKKIIKLINDPKPDIIFVGLGSPKQEYFIYDNWQELNVKLAMGVGIALDYSAGVMPRAPIWLRNLGLEWSYRVYREPGRLFWRYLRALIFFPVLVLKELLLFKKK